MVRKFAYSVLHSIRNWRRKGMPARLLETVSSCFLHLSGGKSFQQNNHDSSSEVPRGICPPPAAVFPTSKESFRSESPEYLSRMAALVGYAKTISCRIRYSKASSRDRAVRAPDSLAEPPVIAAWIR